MRRCEYFDGFNKGALVDCHYNVYWIKILLTLKTTGKVCLWVGCGMKVSAQWAEEAQVAITLLCE